MPVVFSILRLPAVLGLLLAMLVCSGCGQTTARQSAPDHAPIAAQVATEQQTEVVAEPTFEQPATAQQPLLFADERPESHHPRGPPGLTFLPFFPAPLILPADLVMPSEVGVLVQQVARGQRAAAWVAVSPIGFRFATVQVATFRAYNPVMGRWLSRDPIGELDGINAYSYLGQNPNNWVDRLGLCKTGGGGWGGWFGGGWISGVQSALDFAGYIPIVGTFADLANAGIYAAQGDWGNASLSAIGSIPGIGDGIKGGVSAIRAGSKLSAETGSYTITFASGKMYHGKGGRGRMNASAKRLSERHEDAVMHTDWTPSANQREAFMDEAQRIRADGGVANPMNYNKINSPGEKMLQRAGCK